MAVRIETHAEPIPGYQLVDRLGGGGFGEVWKAIAPGGLHKAIKFVFGDLRAQSQNSENQIVRAEQELKALSRVKTVRHPYILSLERFDIIDGQLIIVMELADKNLWDRFRECRSQGQPGIPREELLRYMEETAEALDLMNGEHQLQHLDIKPQNIFLVHNHVKVADFGLVKDLEGMVASVTGGVTPVYAAPETFDGWVSRFCDQYSLGIVYQELLTGQRPFSGTNVRQLIMQHLQAEPNVSPLPAADRGVVARTLAKSPDARFPTCTEFVKALRLAGQEPPTATLNELGLRDRPSAPAESERKPAGSPSDHDEETTSHLAARVATVGPGPRPVPSPAVDSLSEVSLAFPLEPAPLEIQGDGVLLPALVIGLGGLGLQLLQRFRGNVVRQMGTLDAVPHLRLLHIDTDPEARQALTAAAPEESLVGIESYLTRLNRPSHYLRSPDVRSLLESWMDVQMLYRIPRTPSTAGLRALGRLAFVDNYQLTLRRMDAELEACLDPSNLTTAFQRTGLTVRSNRPRVYILTGLAGGTGGGFFLDLAYLLRSLLVKKGYINPDLVGLFYLPAASKQGTRGLALANTFAALTELHHFSAPGTVFSARYVHKARPVQDSGSPFARSVLLPLPDTRDVDPFQELLDLSADFLVRDLLTPLGRLADTSRSQVPVGQGLTCQSFGMYRLSWPRQALLHRLARRICRQITERWSTKDATPLLETVRERIAGEWASRGLTPENVIEELQRGAEKGLGEAPDSLIVSITAQLAVPTGKAPEIDPTAYEAAFAKLEKLVGRLDADTLTRPPVLIESLQEASADLVARWCKQLEAVAVDLVELPEFRLAGAEEALRQFMATIQKTLEHYEPLSTELNGRVAEARTRIDTLFASLQGGRRTVQAASGLAELLKQYPKWRYQSLVLQYLTNTYVSLRGRLSDQLREINFCRARLYELQQQFADSSSADLATPRRAAREFFPNGSRDLEEALQNFFEKLQPADWQEVDLLLQALLEEEFGGFVSICLAPANCLPRLETAMLKRVESFAAEALGRHDVAEMFMARYREKEAAQEAVAAAFDEAAPEFATARLSRQPEICILATPATADGDYFREMVNQTLPDVAPVSAAGGDDIVFYREVPNLLIGNLDQLGPYALEAYRQSLTVAQLSPHNRQDIREWLPIGTRPPSRSETSEKSV